MIKQIIAAVATFAIIGLSIYFIILFFDDYNYIYLVAGILVPLIVMLTSSQYCSGNLVALIIIVGGGIGFLYFESPYSHLSGAFSVYFIQGNQIRQ